MILHLLTLLFIGLKLTGYIDWNWFLVTLPSVIAVTLAITILTIAALADN